ncbi:hypothetical protein [uncultured Ruminococcus sp.]|uniref:hypothetical protein n=1 Tax=uncultured Ruminococcus sp. TaxID=165186 RepID=UPI000ED5B866|nr:hypothetical protein [uncultured Ruminococcus sp.]HCJ41809.1 hypothetical protein [Ruminococcus sp.]
MALIYEFPPKLSRTEKQAKAINDLAEHRKMSRQMYRNLILAGIIFVLAVIVKVMLIKVLLMAVAVANAAVGVLLYRYYSLSRDTRLYTRIYPDRTEHLQKLGLLGDMLEVTLYYDEVEKSEQDPRGNMCFHLKAAEKSAFYKIGRKGERREFQPKDGILVLRFIDTKAKLTLIDKLHEEIKYPKKNYNVITDDDDYYSEEDMEWDKLHKHGL